jgi:PAS domain S-box-containing protein
MQTGGVLVSGNGARVRIERWLVPVLVVSIGAGLLDAFLWHNRWPFACLAALTCVVGLCLGLATRYRHARQNLQSALQFQQTLLDRIPIPVFYKDEKCVYFGCNKSYEEFLGLERSVIIGKRVYEIAPAELARIYDEQDRQLLDQPGVQIYECQVQSKSEQAKRHVVFHKATFTGTDGRLAGIIGGIIDITARKHAEMQKEQVIADLRQALQNVKLLSGLLPICASCKKIRDDKGYWNQIEAYIRDHSEAKFSHGICPDCQKTLYAEFCEDVDAKAPGS